MKIVVGLGNPGKEYEQTPHNAGFAVVDALAREEQCRLRGSWRFRAHTGSIRLADAPVLLVKPDTFMNRSGEAVSAILRWQKAPAEALLVVLDDADLPVGRLRMRPGGSSGGHRGLGSITDGLGTEQVARLRVGVGRGASGERDLVRHVLSPLSPEDRRQYEAALTAAALAVRCWVEQGVDAAMNAFNRFAPPA